MNLWRPSRTASRARSAGALRALSVIGRRASLVGVTAILTLAACENYLTEPGEGEPEAPVLENVVLSPATVNAVDAPGDLNTAVEARTRSGIDAVSVVLKSPSGNDRLACDMSAPDQGDAFDGRWRCDLTVVQGSESGIWVPDSIGLFSSGADGGVRYFTNDELTEAGYQVEVEIISAPPVPTELTVAPDSAELPDAGSEVTLVATVLDQYGRPIPAAPVVWSSDDPSVAAVTDAGVVTPVGVGATRIVAAVDALSDTATIVVPSTPTVLEITPAPVALDSVGATVQLAAEVRNQFDEVLAGETVTWTSADPAVATVDATGLVTAVDGGLTTVQARAAGLTTDVVVSVTGGTPPPGFTWTNLSGGSWHDAANWDRGAVPGPADTAFVRLDGSYTVTVNANASVAVLEVDNASGRPRLDVTAGTFTVADSAWFGPGSTVALRAGRWNGDGDLVVADSLVWTGGFHSGSGATRVTPTGSLSLTGAGTKTLQGRSLLLEGQGLVDGGSFDLTEAAELTVAAGATLDVGGTSILSSSTGAQVGRVVVNGTLRQPDTLGDSSLGARLVNEGLVSIGFGRLLVTSGEGRFEGSGEWWVQADATLRTTATGEIGAGGLMRGAGTWENRGGGTILGSVDMDGGIVFGNPETILRVNTSDTVRVNRLQVTQGGMLDLDPTATVQVRSDFQFGPGPGIVMGGGSLHLPAGTQGRVNPTSGFSVVLGAGTRMDVGGLLLWEEGGFGLEQGSVIEIANGGELALEADATLTATGGTLGDPVIISDGDISREQGTGTGIVQADVVNRGRITARTGTLDLDGGFTHESGAMLRGIGILDLGDTDPVSFQGDVGPGLDFGGAAGGLTVQGSLALTGTSTLSLELGGTTGGTDADLLDVSGTFTASGTLDVSGLGGYQPAAGDTIEVLRYGSRAGGFDAVTGLDFAVAGGGEPLDTVFEANRLILVGPEPAPATITGEIVFSSDRSGRRELWRKNLETGVVSQITDNVYFAATPDVSPDGSRIAYADNANDILIINVDGTGETSLTGSSSAAVGASPSWSPDGTSIAYQGGDTDYEVVRVPVADTSARVFLTQNSFEDRYPAYSPDGTRIAYVEDDGFRDRVVTIDATDGSGRQQLTNGTARYPDWSPDGSEIVYSEATVGGGWSLYAVNVATGSIRTVVNDSTFNWYPTWSPDGNYILYAKNPDFGTAEFDLYAVRADGSGEQIAVETGAGNDTESDWVESLAAVNAPPATTISAPADESIFSPGQAITFSGSATDPEDGVLTGASLVWSSSIDGGIGTGETLTVSDLSLGDHVITLTATDSQGATGSGEINLTVSAEADLSVAMTVTPDSLAVGDTLTHTVTVTNGGPDAVNDVELSLLVEGDVLFAFVEEEGCGNFTTTDPPQKLFQCQLGTLAAGADTTLVLRVLPQAAETLTSTAEISNFTGAIDPDATDRSSSDVTQVTAGTFVPPRTGFLAVASERDFTSRAEIYVDDLDAGTFTRITTNSYTDTSPALSPDATRIAYFSEEAGVTAPMPILIENADGTGNLTRVELTERIVRKFSWSPDGTELAFVDRIGGVAQIWIADVSDPTIRRQIVPSATAAGDPAWSPDGLRIAYLDGTPDLVSVNAADSSDPRVILPNPTGSSTLSHPVYSPDGSEIALVVDLAIWVVDVATGASRVVVDALPGARDRQGTPAWSPDGQTLIFSRRVNGVSDGIWAVPADGSLDPVPYFDEYGEEGLGNWVSR